MQMISTSFGRNWQV